MKEYHLNADNLFIIRENSALKAVIELSEALQFAPVELPQGCTDVLVCDGITYITINKAMEGSQVNPLAGLIAKEAEIIAFYEAKMAAAAEPEIVPEPAPEEPQQ